jgi:hypothetical protein
MKKLPKRIYVKWEDDDEPYLVAQVTSAAFAEINENAVVGVYELVHKGTIVTKPEVLFET